MYYYIATSDLGRSQPVAFPQAASMQPAILISREKKHPVNPRKLIISVPTAH